MNFLQRIGALFRPQGFGQTQPDDPRRLTYLPLPTHAAGLNLTMDVAMQVSVVWACIDAITKAVASSKWKVYEIDERHRHVLPDDPLTWILNARPNPELTAIAWRESMLYQVLTWGNSYSEVVRSRAGKIVELWPLRSDRMQVLRTYYDDGSPGPLVYRYYNWSGRYSDLTPQEVLHFRGPCIDGLMGDNSVARAARSIGLAAAQERFLSSYYANNAVMGTVLKYPKTLSAEAHKRLKDDWEDKHTGPDKSHRPFILEGGMELEELSRNVGEVSPVEGRSFSVEEICRFWGVPPHKVQHLEKATFNNIEHLGMEFVRDAVTPWTLRLEQEVDYKLLPQKSPWRSTKIDTEWLSHGDAKSRAEAYQFYRRMGVYSANDILEKEGANTIGAEGDVRLVESNMTPLERMMADTKKPEIFQYHLAAGIPTVNEVRERLDLPPRADGDVPTSTAAPAPFGGAPKPPAGEGEKKAGEDEEKAGEGEKKAGEDEETDDAAASKMDVGEELRNAVTLLVTGTLNRYRRRQENRVADLRRKKSRTESEIQMALVELRQEQRAPTLEELTEAVSLLKPLGTVVTEMDLVQAIDAIDTGADDVQKIAGVLVSSHR